MTRLNQIPYIRSNTKCTRLLIYNCCCGLKVLQSSPDVNCLPILPQIFWNHLPARRIGSKILRKYQDAFQFVSAARVLTLPLHTDSGIACPWWILYVKGPRQTFRKGPINIATTKGAYAIKLVKELNLFHISIDELNSRA